MMPAPPSRRETGPCWNLRSSSTATRRSAPHVSGTPIRLRLPRHVRERELRAVAEAVAVGVRDERQEHQPVAQRPERLQHRRPRHLHGMRALVDQDDQHHLVDALDRSVALPDLDGLEPVRPTRGASSPRQSRPERAARRRRARRSRSRRRPGWCGCRGRRRRPGARPPARRRTAPSWPGAAAVAQPSASSRAAIISRRRSRGCAPTSRPCGTRGTRGGSRCRTSRSRPGGRPS